MPLITQFEDLIFFGINLNNDNKNLSKFYFSELIFVCFYRLKFKTIYRETV